MLAPQLLMTIAKNGTPEQRHRALETLGIDSTFRSLRKSTIQTKRF